jgi:hypothetical protein
VPALRDVGAGDVVVVDLSDPPEPVDFARLAMVGGRVPVYVVSGEGLISPRWLEFVSHGKVQVVPDHRALVAAVVQRLRGPSGERLGELVVQAAPALRAQESLVQAICAAPWAIRRPRDLASSCGLALAELKRRCRTLGFVRVEHFLMCVRLVAYEQLVAVHRLPVATARLLAGFGDPSNLRRHAKRAALRSAPVALAVASLPARPPGGRLIGGGEECA